MTVEAIIFDFDGVIIDTETPDFETWRDVYRKLGLDLTPELWLQRVGAAPDSPGFDPVHYYEQITGKPLDPGIRQQQWADYIAYCERQPILPGVMSVLKMAEARGIKLGVASNSYHDWVDGYLERFKLKRYFSCVCTRGDVDKGKPAPDLYLSAISCLDIAPQRSLAIEDSPMGMQAALAAGIRVIAVLNPLTAPLARPDVSLTLNSLTDLDPLVLLSNF